MVEATKMCAHPQCGRLLPLGDFYRRKDSKDGHQAWCKRCSRENRARWAEDNRDLLRSLHRMTHERRMADPDRASSERVRKREWQRRARGVKPENYRSSVYTRTPRPAMILPGAPFVAWIESVLERDGTSLNELAARWGISDKTLREIRKGRRDPDIDTVERALIADDVATLDDVYPDLFLEAA